MAMLKGWRTRVFSIAVFALGLLQTLDPRMIANLFPAERQGLVFMAIAVGIYLLRQITTTPPGQKD